MEGLKKDLPKVEEDFGLTPKDIAVPAGKVALQSYRSYTQKAQENEIPVDPSHTDENDLWKRAACRGLNPNLFHPDENDQKAIDKAKEVCESCPVKVACLNYALSHREKLGIWGGKTAQERRGIVRRRNRQKS